MRYRQVVIATDLPSNFALLEMSRICAMLRLAEKLYLAMVRQVGRMKPWDIIESCNAARRTFERQYRRLMMEAK